MRNIVQVARTRAIFLWLLFAVPAASVGGHSLTSGKALIKGQDLGIVMALFLISCTAISWFFFTPTMRWSSFTLVGITALGALWAFQLILLSLDQAAFTMASAVVPAGLAMIALKRVSSDDIQVAVLTMAYSLLAISLVALIGGKLGWMPDGFSGTSGAAVRYEILQSLGIPGRWGGPFGSPNLSTPIGGIIFLLGITSRSSHRVILTGGGLLVLLLGQSRSTILAVLVALTTYALTSVRITVLARRVTIWAVSAALLAALAAIYALVLDPTLNGRTDIWANFGGEFLKSPVFGIRDSGVIGFVNDNTGLPGFIPHVHAHSVIFDGLVRYGAVFTVAVVLALVLAFVAAARGAYLGAPVPLVLLVFVVVAGLTETLHSWIYWSPYLAIIVVALLAYDTPLSQASPHVGKLERFVSSDHVPQSTKRE